MPSLHGLNSIHYRSIRAAVWDYTRQIPRPVLNIIAKRATPKQWCHYATAKCIINLYNNGTTRIGRYLREKSCIDDRNPGKAVFFSDAKKKSGKICILSKLHFLNEKNFDWVGNFSEDALRKNLKRQFIHF